MTDSDHHPLARFLGHLAFAILIAIVVARCLMLEAIRSVGDFSSVGGSNSQGPGAATSIMLDWLSIVPVLLILGRRVLDPSRTIRFAWASVLLAALAVWALASVVWADDKYLALISAARIASGAAIFWSATQLVTRWDHLRVIVGIVIGVLLVNVAQGVIYQNFELAELKQFWTANRAQIFESHGWKETDYTAQRFEMKVLAGEMLNFSMSANVLGAIIVSCALAAFAAGMQRLEDKDDHGWAGALFITALGSAYVLAHTGSKASWAALGLGLALLVGWRLTRDWLERSRTRAFTLGIAAIALGVAGVVTLGLVRHGLPSASLNFRWRYWIGSWQLFLERPFTGIGWGNFGDAYLRYRLPEATEEIQDPHSFPVRLATELGLVGLVLGIAWLIAWGWRASQSIGVLSPTAPMRISRVLMACIPMLVLVLVCNIDFAGDGNYAVLETFRRCVHIALVALALGLVCLGKRQSPDEPFFVDDRPAPWLAAGLFVGVVMMLVQSTIDIALFQPGPWALMAVVMGALVGMANPVGATLASPAGAERFDSTSENPRAMQASPLRMRLLVTCATLAWLITGAAIVARVVVAEAYLAWGDEAVEKRNAKQAWLMYQYAVPFSPVSNYETATKEAQIYDQLASSGGQLDMPPDYTPRVLYDRMIAAAPGHPMSWLTRSRWLSARKEVTPADAQESMNDFGRAVALNPNDVDLRIEYADLLERFGKRAEAAEQLEAALAMDDKLDRAEPERLELRSPGRYEAIRKRIDVLRTTQHSS
jgi:O-antigen ligase